MKVSPIDIRKHEFGKQVRGFDIDEVKSFLTLVADELEIILKKQSELEEALASTKERLAQFEAKENSLQESLVGVQQVQKHTSVKADEEADLIRQKARLEADQIIHEAHRQRDQLIDDLHRLDGQRRGYMIKMKHILQSQLDLMEILRQE